MSTTVVSIDLAELAAVTAALWLGTAMGALGAVWAGFSYIRGASMRVLERALQREIAASAAREVVFGKTIERLRKQRNELLSACSDARSALLEVQLEARAREEQIRRQAANSGFGAL